MEEKSGKKCGFYVKLFTQTFFQPSIEVDDSLSLRFFFLHFLHLSADIFERKPTLHPMFIERILMNSLGGIY